MNLENEGTCVQQHILDVMCKNFFKHFKDYFD